MTARSTTVSHSPVRGGGAFYVGDTCFIWLLDICLYRAHLFYIEGICFVVYICFMDLEGIIYCVMYILQREDLFI